MKPVLALLTLCLCLAGCGEKSTPPTNGDDPAPAPKLPDEPPIKKADPKTPPAPELQAEPTEAEKKQFAVMKAQAEKGDSSAQWQLGRMYYYGRGVKKNYVEALKWYRKVADRGDGTTMVSIGNIYDLGGHGVEQDYVEAVKWYRKAAAQDYYGGDLRLGWCYRDGRGVKQDYAEAMKFFLRAAEKDKENRDKGWMPYSIAGMYRDGLGVKQDHAEAVKWYRKAADQGRPKAQKDLEELIEANKKAEPKKK